MTMAMTGLLALLDDITTLLDDVAIFSKVAVKKTAGVLGDDLALNAEQVSGVKADRELPVVWAVAKGSFLNKLILVPLALAISAFVPWLIQPLLMAGGLYLCFEGAEKILHSFKNNKDEKDTLRKNVQQAKSDAELLTLEKDKVRGAIRTDFVLSAEIIVIALGTVADQDLITQALVVSLIAFVVTVGVYLLVGLIVRLDDIGLHLHQSSKKIIQQLGFVILKGAPMLIRLLTIVGTIAMFLVGGGIFVHGLPVLHHVAELAVSGDIAQLPVMTSIINTGVSLLVGLIIGSVAVLIASFLPKK
ncbi:MAG: putative DNA repair protein MutK, partial [Marinomonas primoryensis]